MNGLLVEAVKQVPALAVLAFVVVVFLREIRLLRDSWQSIVSKLSETLSSTAKECHEVSDRMVNVTAQTNELIRRIEPKLAKEK